MWLKTDISVHSYQIDLDIGTLETVDKFLFWNVWVFRYFGKIMKTTTMHEIFREEKIIILNF
jgi:hypothetical protein